MALWFVIEDDLPLVRADTTRIRQRLLSATFAMWSLSRVPVFTIFIIFQRYRVQGISSSGLKG